MFSLLYAAMSNPSEATSYTSYTPSIGNNVSDVLTRIKAVTPSKLKLALLFTAVLGNTTLIWFPGIDYLIPGESIYIGIQGFVGGNITDESEGSNCLRTKPRPFHSFGHSPIQLNVDAKQCRR